MLTYPDIFVPGTYMRHAARNWQRNVTLHYRPAATQQSLLMVHEVGTTDSKTVDLRTSRMTPSQSKMRAHGAGPRSDADFVALLIPAAGGSRKDGARNFKGWTNPDASSIKENTQTIFHMVAGSRFTVVKTTRKSAPSGVSYRALKHSSQRVQKGQFKISPTFPDCKSIPRVWKTLIRSFSPTAYILYFVRIW